MVWSTAHGEMLYREILVIDPFTGTRKSTVARGTKWEEVAENLNKIKQIYFRVDKRAVRDCYIRLYIPYHPSCLSRIVRILRMGILDFSRSFLHTAK